MGDGMCAGERRTLGILAAGDVDELLDIADFFGLQGARTAVSRGREGEGDGAHHFVDGLDAAVAGLDTDNPVPVHCPRWLRSDLQLYSTGAFGPRG